MSETSADLSELPDGWVWTTLGEIIEPSKEKVNPLAIEEVPYISLEHIEKDTGKLSGHGRSSDVRSSKTKFNRGDLLYGKLRPYLNKVYVSDFEGVCSTDLLVFSKNELLSNAFLLYRFLCRDFVNYASHNVNGINLPRVNFQTLSRFKIPLPSLPEQHRIVAKIEELFTKLDAGINELHKAQSQLKRYRQSVLKAAFEGKLTESWRAEHQDGIEPASVLLERILKEQLEQIKTERKMFQDNKSKVKCKKPSALDISPLPELPDGWVWATVKEIAEFIRGVSYKKNESSKTIKEGHVPILRANNINRKLNYTDLVYVPRERIKDEQFIKAFDIVVAMSSGSKNLVGKAAQSYQDYHGAFGTFCGLVRVSPQLDRKFIGFFFQSSGYRNEISRLSSGMNINNLRRQHIESMCLPIPPLSEQHRIVSEVEHQLSIADEVEKTITAELKRAEQLRQSILKKAFSGKLVPQAPNDEPATALLERIKAQKDIVF